MLQRLFGFPQLEQRADLHTEVVRRCAKGMMIWQTDVLLGFLIPMLF